MANYDPKDSEFTEDCPHFCLKKTNWIPYVKGIHNYAKPCPIHRPGWRHPDDRPDPEAAKKEAENRKRTRETATVIENENERADW